MGKQNANDNVRARRTEGLAREHEFQIAEADDFPTYDSGQHRPGSKAECQHDTIDPRAKQRNRQSDEKETGQHLKQFRGTHEEVVHEPAHGAGDHSDGDTASESEQCRRRRDYERRARAVEDAAQQVPAESVGSHQVKGGRSRKSLTGECEWVAWGE